MLSPISRIESAELKIAEVLKTIAVLCEIVSNVVYDKSIYLGLLAEERGHPLKVKTWGVRRVRNCSHKNILPFEYDQRAKVILSRDRSTEIFFLTSSIKFID